MNNTVSIPTMLTIKETAKKFKLSENFLRNCVTEGQIVAIRSGRKVLINAEKLAEYLNNNTISQTTPKTKHCDSYSSSCHKEFNPRSSRGSFITPISKK